MMKLLETVLLTDTVVVVSVVVVYVVVVSVVVHTLLDTHMGYNSCNQGIPLPMIITTVQLDLGQRLVLGQNMLNKN